MKPDAIKLTAEKTDLNKRLDVFISQRLNISRNNAQKQCVYKNGKQLNKNYIVCDGDVFELILEEPKELDAVPQKIEIEIIYEDNDLIVVNKPQGMVVHPAPGNPDNTLVNALMYHCAGRLSSINGIIRPGIVHRIDKDTAGLLIVAKNDAAHEKLAAQIAAHSFTRKYEAIVYGKIKDESGTVDAPIGRHKTDRKKMAVTKENSKPAITHYKKIEEYDGYTRLELLLETGRTHQIRVHMASIGHPVVGDYVYAAGRNMLGLKGQCLFAKHIGFVHPTSGKWLEFTAPLPDFFLELIKKLKQNKQF